MSCLIHFVSQPCTRTSEILNPSILTLNPNPDPNQEELLARSMTLVLNVKAELMERLARCMGTSVAPSVEELHAGHVGTCREFRVDPMSAHATAGGPAAVPAFRASSPANAGGGVGEGVVPSSSSVCAAGKGNRGGGEERGGGAGARIGTEAGAAPGSQRVISPPLVPAGGTPSTAVGPGAAASGGGAAAAAVPSSTRTLMCFGCAVPLGATLLLKGADASTLTRVKRVRVCDKSVCAHMLVRLNVHTQAESCFGQALTFVLAHSSPQIIMKSHGTSSSTHK